MYNWIVNDFVFTCNDHSVHTVWFGHYSVFGQIFNTKVYKKVTRVIQKFTIGLNRIGIR